MSLLWNILREQHTTWRKEITLQWLYYPSSSNKPWKTDHFACIHFLSLWPIQLFWGFVHKSLVVIAIYSCMKEYSYYLLLTFWVAASLHLNPEIGYLTYWLNTHHLKCENKCFSKCLPHWNFISSQFFWRLKKIFLILFETSTFSKN